MSMCASFAKIDPNLIVRLQRDPSLIHEWIEAQGEGAPEILDIDKSWHGIHFLLTGSADGGEGPLAAAVFGGEEIGDDIGYGPARLLMPQEVQVVAAALEALGLEAFVARYAPEALTAEGIYPDGIWSEDPAEARDYLVDNFKELLGFYAKASRAGAGILMWVG